MILKSCIDGCTSQSLSSLATQKETYDYGKTVRIQIILRQMFKGFKNYGCHLKCCSLALCCAQKRVLQGVKMSLCTQRTRCILPYSFFIQGTSLLKLPSFHTEDQVFLEGDDLLREYVLADTGLIWRGSYNRLRPCVWKYAQFEKDILDCSLYLVSHVGKLTLAGRSDPVKTCRVLSAAVSV